jgi:hypothetical protein
MMWQQMGGMWQQMGGWMALYGLIWIVVVALAVIALWRGMLAQEAMVRHLETIARQTGSRSA